MCVVVAFLFLCSANRFATVSFPPSEDLVQQGYLGLPNAKSAFPRLFRNIYVINILRFFKSLTLINYFSLSSFCETLSWELQSVVGEPLSVYVD